MASHLPITLWEVPEPYELGDKIGEKGVIEAVQDPGPERMHLEKYSLLAQLIKLRVAVKQASRYELVEYPDHERWENREEYVVE